MLQLSLIKYVELFQKKCGGSMDQLLKSLVNIPNIGKEGNWNNKLFRLDLIEDNLTFPSLGKP